MGMGVSFIFMWVTSIMEMWLYKPVYVDGVWYHYQQWKIKFAESSYEEKLKNLMAFVSSVLTQVKQLVGVSVQKILKKTVGK
jgi:hypothetical protein